MAHASSQAGSAPGMLLVISGPSGVGKTTITHRVEKAISGACFSVSATTRPPAPGDREGKDYFFISDERFDRMIAAGEFLEHAGVFGKRYGTPKAWVCERLAEGRLVILEIDVQGAMSIKRQAPEAYSLFILPPSEEALLERLRNRRREDEGTIQRRFAEARKEIETAKGCGVYDLFITNHVLEDAVNEAIDAVKREMARRHVSAGGNAAAGTSGTGPGHAACS